MPEFDPYHVWLGIPPDEQPPNHYRLLGISLFESDRDVIRNAADQRMTHLKTFGAGRHSELSQKLLNEVSAAKVCLLDEAGKHAYDDQLRILTDSVRPAEGPRTEQASHGRSYGQSNSARPGTMVDTQRLPVRRRRKAMRFARWPWAVSTVATLLLFGVAALIVYYYDNTGTIRIKVDTSDLAVYVDGTAVVSGEKKRYWIGQHELVVRHRDRVVDATGFAIRPGQNDPVRVVTGTIKINLGNPTLDVLVDGDEVVAGENLRLRVGDHHLEVRDDGRVIQTRHFTVLQGSNSPVLCAFYSLEGTFPPNAQFGRDTGELVLEPTMEDVGRYQVTIRGPGATAGTDVLQHVEMSPRFVLQGGRLDLTTESVVNKVTTFRLRVSALRQSQEVDVFHDIMSAVYRKNEAIILDLREKGMKDYPYIGHLTRLKSLDWSDSRMKGFPSELGWLRELEELDLSGNELVAITHEIGLMTRIRVLDVSDNKLNALPGELDRLSGLEYLYARNNNIMVLPRQLASCKKLKLVDVRGNPLPVGETDWLRSTLPDTATVLCDSSDRSAEPDNGNTARFQAIPNQQTAGGRLLSIPLVVDGVERNARLKFRLLSGVGEISDHGTFEWTPSEEQGGRHYTVRVGAICDDDLLCEVSFSIVVEELPEVLPGEWIDGLQCVNPEKNRVSGNWAFDHGVLETDASEYSRIVVPIAIKGAYDLEVEFTRKSGNDSVNVIFPVARQLCNLVLGGANGTVSGLQMVNGQRVGSDESAWPPVHVVNGQLYKVLLRVRLIGDNDANIEVMLNNKPYLAWKGKQRLLRLSRKWDLPQPFRPAVGAFASDVAFSSVRLRMESGRAVPDALGLSEPYVLTSTVGGAGQVWRGCVDFRDFAPNTGFLVGIRFSVWRGATVNGIQPVYATSEGLAYGREYGIQGAKSELIAPDGYAVGDFIVKYADRIDGMRLVFMRIDGDSLDPSDTKESPWIGGYGGGPEVSLGGTGSRVIGIHGMDGKYYDWGTFVGKIGLILEPDENTPDGN